jgi:hypothetical protein
LECARDSPHARSWPFAAPCCWWRRRGCGCGASSAAIGTLFVGWSDPGAAMTPGVYGSSTPVSERVKIGWFDWRMPPGAALVGVDDVPLWFVALLPGAGFRTAEGADEGFPVEAAAASIS